MFVFVKCIPIFKKEKSQREHVIICNIGGRAIHTFTDNTIPPKDHFWVRIRPIIAKYLEVSRPIIAEYLEVTTIHGLRYLMECKSIIEKLFWLLIICFSFGYATHIIQSFFADNDREPILTTIQTGSVQDVPFPAITIR